MTTNDTEKWDTLNARMRMHTITFHYPRAFLRAVASSLGRLGDEATHSEAEEFIREAVKANIACLMEEHLGRKSVMKIRVSKGTGIPSNTISRKIRVKKHRPTT